MGFVKQLLDLDYSPSGVAVCVEHLDDQFLARAVANEVQEHDCFVCGRSGNPDLDEPFAVPLDKITEQVLKAVNRHFTPAVERVPYDSREGGWVWPTQDGDDVVYAVCESAFVEDHSERIVRQILDSIDDEQWLEENRAVESAERMWEAFSRTVRHESRFMLFDVDDEGLDIDDEGDPDTDAPRRSPSLVIRTSLSALAGTIEELNLTVTEPEGTIFYRGRLVESPYSGRMRARHLGPPPYDKAAANRMSPPGIVMFYASGDVQTAIKEIAGHGPQPYACIGAFRSTRPLRIIDLTSGRLPLHYFDEQGFPKYEASRFLGYFVEEITKPIIPDGREHREYVPTQVLTEYLRWGQRERVDGIKLPSAQSGLATYVLFFDSTNVADDDSAEGELAKRYRTRTAFTLAAQDVQVYEVRRAYDGVEIPKRFAATFFSSD